MTVDQAQAYKDIEFPDQKHGSDSAVNDHDPNQFYMWEGVNPRESADFENDIIASTNEVTYTKALLKEQAHPLFDQSYINERVLEQEDSYLIFGDCDEQDDDDRELSLDMADFLNDGNPVPQLPIAREEPDELQVFAGER